jgi:hypothetical protein
MYATSLARRVIEGTCAASFRPQAVHERRITLVEPVSAKVEPGLWFAGAAKPEIQKWATQTGPPNAQYASQLLPVAGLDRPNSSG